MTLSAPGWQNAHALEVRSAMSEGDEREINLPEVGIRMVLSGGGALVALYDPVAGVTAAAALPALDAALERFRSWRAERLRTTIEDAADRAGTDIGSLVEALTADAARLRLLVDALEATERAVLDEKLAALASSLAGAALSVDDLEVHRETLIVAALTDIEAPHVHLLDRFQRSSQELGLGTGTDPMATLSWHQLERVADWSEGILESLVGTLVRHGLVATLGGGAMFGGGSGTSSYRITDFGALILERLGRRS